MTKTNYEKTKKILFLGFLVFVFLAISNPFKTEADSLINWKNPNADGGGPFRLSGDNILEIIQEEGLITQVIGCTGVIDKVAGVLYDLESIGSALLSNPKDTINLLFSEKARAKACRSTKGASETAVGGTPQMTLPPGLELIIDCGPYANEGSSPKTDQKLEDLKKQEEKKKFTQDCLNGIAFTLAKNQLTSMARSTMNWINAGLDGNPYFVQSTRSVLNSVERNIVEPAILGLSDKAFPYGDTFVLSYVNRFRNTNNMTIDRGLLGNLASNMADYIIVDYREDPDLSPLENKQAMEKKAIEKFSQDFSSGGWDGWAAMILGDKNNPLGFYSAASRAISRKVEEATQDVRDEIEQGYLNQTECVKWQSFDEDGKPVKKDIRISGLSGNVAVDIEYHTYPGPQRSPNDTEKNDVCVQTKVITPAAHIKAKAEEILQTPTRQLELADNINSVLNSVFSVLLYALQNQGLPGLASGDYNYSTDSAVTSTISNEVGSDSSLNVNNSNYTKDGSFDITRDLGNTFIYEYNENSFLGYWDANTNTISEQPASGNCFNDEGNEVRCPTTLMKKKAPYCEGEDGSKINCGANFYYIVSNPGKADIIQNSYNTWAKGDRAFWDGSSWQNWKCQGGGFDMKGECTIQKNPIKNRGVLQLQEDYKIVAKEMLAILPSLMGKIGELDYCIPGPNPSWEINAGEPYVKLIEIANSISADYDSSGSKIKKETRYHFPSEGEDLFEDYRSLFRTLDGHEGVLWTKIKETSKKWEELQQPAKIGMFPWKDKNTDQDEIADEMVSRLSNSVTREVENFFKKYDEFIDAHFGILTQEFIEKEDTAKLEKNPHFIPMMKAGLEITSGMLYYDEEVKTLTKKYEDDLQDANSNIYKLSEIKNEVSEIIEAAQKRRTASMIEKIKEEEGLSNFSEQDFYDRYKGCLDEENVKFYEDLDLTDNSGGEEERCSDGIDNDRDGYIDLFDPDCNNRGFSSRAVTEEYNWGPDTNIDSIEVVWHKLDCSPDVFECKNGALVENSKIETDLLYKWTCLSDRGEEKHCEKRNLDLTWNGALKQIGILINDLGDGQINWDAIEYIVAFYEQKALTTDLNWLEEQFKNILDGVLDFRGAATVVGGVIGGALGLLNMLTPVLTALGI
ncbi:MAG: hypothetical protein PHC31_11560 [Clostridia bacterium]|nr:hypothetical protein [Clostridia bacterium]MDD3972537.1 hypothetical protein [Clostridia bacterium]